MRQSETMAAFRTLRGLRDEAPQANYRPFLTGGNSLGLGALNVQTPTGLRPASNVAQKIPQAPSSGKSPNELAAERLKRQKDLAQIPKTQTVKVPAGKSALQIARDFQTTVDELQTLNGRSAMWSKKSQYDRENIANGYGIDRDADLKTRLKVAEQVYVNEFFKSKGFEIDPRVDVVVMRDALRKLNQSRWWDDADFWVGGIITLGIRSSIQALSQTDPESIRRHVKNKMAAAQQILSAAPLGSLVQTRAITPLIVPSAELLAERKKDQQQSLVSQRTPDAQAAAARAVAAAVAANKQAKLPRVVNGGRPVLDSTKTTGLISKGVVVKPDGSVPNPQPNEQQVVVEQTTGQAAVAVGQPDGSALVVDQAGELIGVLPPLSDDVGENAEALATPTGEGGVLDLTVVQPVELPSATGATSQESGGLFLPLLLLGSIAGGYWWWSRSR